MPDVARQPAAVVLYWLPLGAGGRFVRWNGRVFEALLAHHQRRDPCDLYHSALEVRLEGDRFVIEMAPAWSDRSTEHGVVRRGPVGARVLGASALFRYEVRRWRDGTIPDLVEAVGGPQSVGRDTTRARQLLDLVPQVPALTWGRDELDAGEMWNSNSLTSWLLARSEHDPWAITPPARGRAPGWDAGLALARRESALQPRQTGVTGVAGSRG